MANRSIYNFVLYIRGFLCERSAQMIKTSAAHQVSSSLVLRTIHTLQLAICKGLRRGEQTPFSYVGFATQSVLATLNRIGIRLSETPVFVEFSEILGNKDNRLKLIKESYGVFGIQPPANQSDRGVVLVVPKFTFSGESVGDRPEALVATLSKIMALGLVEGLARCEQVLRMRAMQSGENLSPATSWITQRILGDQLTLHPDSSWCDLDGIARVVEIAQEVGVEATLLEPQLFGLKTRSRAEFVAGMLNVGVVNIAVPEWWRGFALRFLRSPLTKQPLAKVAGV